jgi:hypothetical protein
MKRVVLAATVLLAVGLIVPEAASAQTVGAKVGYLWSEIRGDDGVPTTSYSKRRDWSLGLFTRFSAGPVVLQPEFLYSRRGATVVDSNTPDLEQRFRLDYLEVPVLFRLGGGSTSIYIGGYGAFKISAKAESRPTEGEWTAIDISANVASFDYGITGGIAMDFGKFGLDGRYTLGMARIFTSEVPGLAPDLKHGALGLYATLQF